MPRGASWQNVRKRPLPCARQTTPTTDPPALSRSTRRHTRARARRRSPTGTDTVIEQFGRPPLDAHRRALAPPGFLFSCRVYPDGAGARVDVHEGALARTSQPGASTCSRSPWAHSSSLAARCLSKSAKSARSATHAVPSTISRDCIPFPTRRFWRGTKGGEVYARRYPGNQTRRRHLFVHPRRGPRRD